MTNNLFSVYKARRSQYSLGKDIAVDDSKVEELIREAILHAPSAFNSQSARAILLLDGKHDSFWDAVLEVLRPLTPAGEARQNTEAKIAGFKAAHGTVLFFEDQSVVQGLQAQFALYRDNFPVWSLESSGMLQFMVWTGLAELSIGASLQHYNPLMDEWVRANLAVPGNWKLLAQMPFGKVLNPAGEKTCMPIEERFKIIR